MRLPIRNKSDRPLTIFIEPYCDEHEIPVGGEAIVRLDDGCPHSIEVHDGLVAIWDEGSGSAVEIVSKEQQAIVDAVALARIWLFNLGGRDIAAALDDSVGALERGGTYVSANAEVLVAFRQGFMAKDCETAPAGDALPEWTGSEALADAYRAGGVAAWLNHVARSDAAFPGPGIGPFDTDTVRSAFERAEEVIERQ